MLHRDQADPTRFVEIISQRGQHQEKGSDKYYACRVYFREHKRFNFHGKVDVAKSLFNPAKQAIGFVPIA